MKIAIIRHGETDLHRQGKMQGREDIPGILKFLAQPNIVH
jgi:broad specificity phosphatase PhoE